MNDASITPAGGREFSFGKPPFIVVFTEDGIYAFGGSPQLARFLLTIPFMVAIAATSLLAASKVLSLGETIPYIETEAIVFVAALVTWTVFYKAHVNSKFSRAGVSFNELMQTGLKRYSISWSEVSEVRFNSGRRLDVFIGSTLNKKRIWIHYPNNKSQKLQAFLSEKLADKLKGTP